MGQSMCGGVRECKSERKPVDLGIFDNSQHFCAVRKGSPYYRKKIRKAERRVENARILYQDYKESKKRRSNSD